VVERLEVESEGAFGSRTVPRNPPPQNAEAS